MSERLNSHIKALKVKFRMFSMHRVAARHLSRRVCSSTPPNSLAWQERVRRENMENEVQRTQGTFFFLFLIFLAYYSLWNT